MNYQQLTPTTHIHRTFTKTHREKVLNDIQPTNMSSFSTNSLPGKYNINGNNVGRYVFFSAHVYFLYYVYFLSIFEICVLYKLLSSVKVKQCLADLFIKGINCFRPDKGLTQHLEFQFYFIKTFHFVSLAWICISSYYFALGRVNYLNYIRVLKRR